MNRTSYFDKWYRDEKLVDRRLALTPSAPPTATPKPNTSQSHAAPSVWSPDATDEQVRALLPKLGIPDLNKTESYLQPMFWGVEEQDKAEFGRAVETLMRLMPSAYYASDNLITMGRNNSMLDDKPFVESWTKNAEGLSDMAVLWRRYILATSAFHCIQLGGDFVECGAYTGVGMKTVIDYLGGKAFPRQFWGYDVFEHKAGMPNVPMEGLNEQGLYERVKAKFVGYPQVRLVPGMIPDVFSDGCPDRIAYLHIDLNQAPAEIAALEHLFHRVVPGGVIILDDYEWASVYRVQKLAEDPWFEQRGHRVMPLPTGQGLVIKH